MPAKEISVQRAANGDLVITIPRAAVDVDASAVPLEQAAFGKPSRSALARDLELAAFVADLAKPGTMLLREIRTACVERFGEARAPSMSVIHRFIQDAARGRRRTATEKRVT